MLHLGHAITRTCAGLSRREVLQVGGLGLLGLGLPDVLAQATPPPRRRREPACIVLWLDGRPSHFETFDPKPELPDTHRGPYGAVRTPVPGVWFSELVPEVARRFDKCAVIRSMRHGIDAHAPVPMMTAFQNST